MERKLLEINGYELQGNLPELELIGDLFFYDWALVSVWANDNAEPYLKVWLETANGITRYALFNTEIRLLESYIFGKISYLDLLKNPNRNLMFVIDYDSNGAIRNVSLIASSEFPQNYLPKKHLNFDSDDARDLEDILEVFKLKDPIIQQSATAFDILDEAKKNNSELINIHLASNNNKVGFGKIDSNVLGNTLVAYNKLSEAIVLTLYPRDEFSSKQGRWGRGEYEELKKLAATEYEYDKAASFSVFLKPVKVRYEGNNSSIEKIMSKMFSLFAAGTNIAELSDVKYGFSSEMITAFSAFLKTVKENELKLTVQYGNPFNKEVRSETFNSKTSKEIIDNLKQVETEESKSTTYKGEFTALDKEKNTFKFRTIDNVLLEGRFDKQIIESVPRLSLQKKYSIKVKTNFEKKPGKQILIPRHVIMASFVEKNSAK